MVLLLFKRAIFLVNLLNKTKGYDINNVITKHAGESHIFNADILVTDPDIYVACSWLAFSKFNRFKSSRLSILDFFSYQFDNLKQAGKENIG
jgi:hypothetical protein